MKKQFLLLFFIFEVYSGTDISEPTYKKIKKLDPWGEHEEFNSLAQRMNTEGKSLCDYIIEITQHKKTKAQNQFDLDFPPTEYTNLKFKDIRCNPDIPHELCLQVKEIFNESKDCFEDIEYNGLLKVKFVADTNARINDKNSHFSLHINPKLLLNHSQSIDEILRHEKTHADLRHTNRWNFLREKTEEFENPDYDNHLASIEAFFNREKKYKKFLRSQEFEADVIPATCIQNSFPENFIPFFAENAIEELIKELSWGNLTPEDSNHIFQCLKETNANSNPTSNRKLSCSRLLKKNRDIFHKYDYQHPNNFDRIAWFYKIARLRQAQQRLENLNQMNKIDLETLYSFIASIF